MSDETVKWSEVAAHVEPDGEAPFHPSTGQPQFIRCKLRIQSSYLERAGLTVKKERVKVGISQPDPKNSNLTHLVIILGDPENLDRSVSWIDSAVSLKSKTKGHGPALQLKLEGRKLFRKGLIEHPFPLGSWKGALFVRNPAQVMIALACETMQATRVLPDKPAPSPNLDPPTIILPGDSRW